MIRTIKKIIDEKEYITLIFILVFIGQFSVLIYFNLNMLGNHMGYDSSWSYLKAALMWREKTIHSGMWFEQTSIFLDSSMVLASLLYGVTGNLLLSYGIANIVVLVLVLVCMGSIFNLMEIADVKARWLAYNLLICPDLTNVFNLNNDLGYFNDMLSGPAFYGLRTLIVMLVIREYLYIKRKKRISCIGIITLILCALAGASSGIFIVVMVLLPLSVFIIGEVLSENSLKPIIRLESIYVYLGIAAVMAGKDYAKHFLGVSAIDESRTWTPIAKLFTNFGAPIQGFMKLLGVLPVENTDVAVISKEGIYRVFPIIIFLVIALSICHAVKIMKTDIRENKTILLMITIIATNYIVFGLFNAQYGSAVFEERYLISTFVISLVLVAYYIQNLKNGHIFTYLLVLSLLLCIVANDYVSDKKYIKTTNDSWQMSDIASVVKDQDDTELIYLWGDDLSILGRSMRVYDLDHVYKNISNEGRFNHWGDYKYYEDNSEYDGSTLLIVQNDSDIVPQNIKDEYSLIKKLDNVSIFMCAANPIDGVAGITNTVSVDFPSTPGINTNYGIFDGNSFISDGSEGYIMWGPSCTTQNGLFDFTIDYSIIEGDGGSFDIATDSGKNQLGKIELDNKKESLTIEDIALEAGHTLEYRVFANKGTKIRIDKITIEKHDDANTSRS